MFDRIKKKVQERMFISAMPATLFLVFLFGTMAVNAGKVKSILGETQLSVQGFASLTDSFEETLQGDFCGKYYYVELNGLATDIFAINNLNEVWKFANGYLGNFRGIVDTSFPAENVIALNEFLMERDIDFLYLLAPGKGSVYDAEFSVGYGDPVAWENIDNMIDTLN